MKLAFLFRIANEKYASDYPAAVGNHMTNTDSDPFMDLVPAISLREMKEHATRRRLEPELPSGQRSLLHVFRQGFRLGLNAAQTTLAQLLS